MHAAWNENLFCVLPPAEYCCAGPGKCRIPVPRPPDFESLPWLEPAVRRAANRGVATNNIVKAAANAIPMDINNQFAAPEAFGVEPANVCTAPNMTRVAAPFGSPRTDDQAKILIIRSYKWPPAAGCNRSDGTPYPSPCGKPVCSFVSACSGNTISSGLVLYAAHCVDPADFLAGVFQALRDPAVGYPPNADPCKIVAMPHTLNTIWVSVALQASRENWSRPA
jgi:hypothetical protein